MNAAAPERPRAAMILAAGRGERMRPLTDHTPKPMLQVRGKPLIEHHVERLAQAGIERIVVNLAWLGAMISGYLGDGSRYGVRITLQRGGAARARDGGGDIPRLASLGSRRVSGRERRYLHGLSFRAGRRGARSGRAPDSGAQSAAAPGRGFWPRAGARAAERGLAVHFSGIAVYRKPFFANCVDGVSPLKPLLLRAMAARRCSAELYPGLWEDVGTVERLKALNAE